MIVYVHYRRLLSRLRMNLPKILMARSLWPDSVSIDMIVLVHSYKMALPALLAVSVSVAT